MFHLIENGDVYDPEPRGTQSILIANDRIEIVGDVDRRAIDRLGVQCEVIDAADCYVVPGLIDPHAHLLGGSGEGSLALASPMMFIEEIVASGVTSVVGTLGVDVTMKTIAGLLARVKSLDEIGISTWMWSGGYNVPPTTVMNSMRDDMLYVDEVIGAGEIAVSDERGLNQSAQELAKLVRDTHVGGLLSGKAGVTHFHVGEEDSRLEPLRNIVEEFNVKPESLYPTHVQRNERLLREGIELALAGAHVDMDAVNEDLVKWVPFYIDNGGPLDRLTISSDMDSSTPEIYFQQFCKLVMRRGLALDLVLPLFTSNPARTLKLQNKGCLRAGSDADVVVITKDVFAVRDVLARGKVMVRDGQTCVREKWLAKSKRRFEMVGDEHPSVR